MRRNAFMVLFFLSGVSGLIYELVWQRLLNLVFGVTTLSVSAVLAAFLGGLALGGWLFGPLADRTRRPLRLYAALEMAIGLSSLWVVPGFAWVTGIYPGLYAFFQPGPWGGACLRLILALLVLAIPATLIGATLPVMGRLVSRKNEALSTTFSSLYAINTLGAVLGASLTGFVFLRFLGMQETLWLACSLNILVAFAGFWGSRIDPDVEPSEKKAPQENLVSGVACSPGSSIMPGLALSCALMTGLLTTGFEVVWMRILGILTSNSAYGFALMLTTLLSGIGIGSWVQRIWSRKLGNSWHRLAACQWLLAAFVLATIPLFRTSPQWLDRWCDGSSISKIFLGEMFLTGSLLFVPALFMGMSLPLLVNGVTQTADNFGSWLGRLYSINTLGCVVGAFLTGFVLIPTLGIQPTLGVLVAGCLLVGMAAWSNQGRQTSPARWAFAFGLTSIGILAWVILPAGPYSKSPIQEPRQLLYYREGNNATVNVVEDFDHSRSILVDGQPVAGTVGTSVIDQKMLAHLPLLLHPKPERALTVGFGSGGTSYSMALHGIEVDCVEIEKMVPGAADLFQSENHGILSDPRFHLILDDARSWLRIAPHLYDVIVTDCTNIQYRSNGDLYTVEYFQLLKNRLTDQGVAAAWVPANGIQDRDLRTLLRSFRDVFPHTSIWFMNTLATDFLIVVGTPRPLDIDMDQLAQRIQRKGVYEDLQAVGLSDPYRLLYTFLVGEQELADYLGAGPLNTDDRPVLSYSTYGATFRATIADNLVRLLAARTDPACYVKNCSSKNNMLLHYVASNEAILGHIAYQRGDKVSSLGHYVKGATLMPKDPALEELVRAAYFRVNGPAFLNKSLNGN